MWWRECFGGLRLKPLSSRTAASDLILCFKHRDKGRVMVVQVSGTVVLIVVNVGLSFF